MQNIKKLLNDCKVYLGIGTDKSEQIMYLRSDFSQRSVLSGFTLSSFHLHRFGIYMHYSPVHLYYSRT